MSNSTTKLKPLTDNIENRKQTLISQFKRYLWFTLFSFLLFSCSKENQEVTCNQYFLTEVTSSGITSKIYFNNDGLISSIKNSLGSIQSFKYDQAKKLKEVISGLSKTTFTFDQNGRLISTIRFGDNGRKIDSTSIEYDLNNRIKKFNKYNENDGYISYYQIYQYLDPKTVQVDFYGQDVPVSTSPLKYWGSFKYTLDGKPQPYPIEFYYNSVAYTNTILSSNYISLEIFGGKEQSITNYPYKYNVAGYPLSGNFYEYKYQCEPQKE
jgi:hypothetical protein